MDRYRKLCLLFTVAIVLSIIPFLILGESFETEINDWFRRPWSQSERFWLIVGLLASDILVPIPSSAVSTYGGAILGLIPATIAAWLGMTLGSLFGYMLARWAGPVIVRRMTQADDLAALRQLNERLSIWTIILTRPLPILAEATILLLGSLQLPLLRLLLPLVVSNLVIAFAYASIGAWSITYDVTPYVVVASMVIPLAITYAVRKQLKTQFHDFHRPE